nr:hypothetical protein [Tanacetum cinerariifolium]
MTKVIKGEFKKPESQKISDDSFTYNTSLEIFHEEFNRMSRMDDDLFTYEVEISGPTNIPCDLNEEDDLEQQMTHRSIDDMEYDPSNVKFTEWAFNEFIIFYKPIQMCLPKIPRDLKLTKIIRMTGFMNGMKMCHRCMKDHGWIMEYEKNPLQLDIIDSKLKEESLKNKAIMEGIINEDDESSNNGWRRWDNFKNTNPDHEEREYEMEQKDEESCELFDDLERPVCNIQRFKMIKYSFGENEEYVAIREHEYDNLTSTNEDTCRAYQEIFHKMDEAWMTSIRSILSIPYGVLNVWTLSALCISAFKILLSGLSIRRIHAYDTAYLAD